MSDVVSVRFVPFPETTQDELAGIAESFRAEGATVKVRNGTGILDPVTVLVVSIAIRALVTLVYGIRRDNRGGLLIDNTQPQLKLIGDARIPAGTVLVRGRDGEITTAVEASAKDDDALTALASALGHLTGQ
jgi:hypothetical protein